jgi:hypothetical protein
MEIGAAGYKCFGGRKCLDACQIAILQCQYDWSGLQLYLDSSNALQAQAKRNEGCDRQFALVRATF